MNLTVSYRLLSVGRSVISLTPSFLFRNKHRDSREKEDVNVKRDTSKRGTSVGPEEPRPRGKGRGGGSRHPGRGCVEGVKPPLSTNTSLLAVTTHLIDTKCTGGVVRRFGDPVRVKPTVAEILQETTEVPHTSRPGRVAPRDECPSVGDGTRGSTLTDYSRGLFLVGDPQPLHNLRELCFLRVRTPVPRPPPPPHPPSPVTGLLSFPPPPEPSAHYLLPPCPGPPGRTTPEERRTHQWDTPREFECLKPASLHVPTGPSDVRDPVGPSVSSTLPRLSSGAPRVAESDIPRR